MTKREKMIKEIEKLGTANHLCVIDFFCEHIKIYHLTLRQIINAFNLIMQDRKKLGYTSQTILMRELKLVYDRLIQIYFE